MAELAAVLFDMDGTLIDSETVWDVGLHELAARFGVVLSPAARAETLGTTNEETIRILHRELGVPVAQLEAGCVWLEQRVKALLGDGVAFRPGAAELLAEVTQAGIPSAMVTATRRELVDVVLNTIRPATFDAVVSADDVSQGKPHPLPYLRAAQLLKVDIRDCVAIEDSPTGITSARLAGAIVLAVPSDLELSPVDGVTVVDSLAEVDLDFLRSVRRPARTATDQTVASSATASSGGRGNGGRVPPNAGQRA